MALLTHHHPRGHGGGGGGGGESADGYESVETPSPTPTPTPTSDSPALPAADALDGEIRTSTQPSSSFPPRTRPGCRLCSGVASDIRNRLPHYIDDWTVGLRMPGAKKALSSAVYIFFTNMMPAITFSRFLADRTGNALGTIEVIFAMAIGNAIFSVFAGQPLVVVGVTGPVSIFCATLYDVGKRFDVPFFGWLFYTCLWSGVMHILLAAVNANRAFPKFVTSFSGEIFGFLIGSIYIYEGARELAVMFAGANAVSAASALLSLVLGVGTLWLATQLAGARGWVVFPKGLRGVVADYGASAAILIMTGMQWIPGFRETPVPTLTLPSTFEPSSPGERGREQGGGGGGWVAVDSISSTPGWAIAAAVLPAVVLTALLYFDHNISSMLSQKREFNLKKPTSFDWDFLLLGLVVMLCGVLGLPPNYGLIPQAPLHVRSLAKIREERNGGPVTREVWVRVVETRVSNFLQAVLTFALLSDSLLRALGTVPKGVLAGLFLHLGIAGLEGNGLARRLVYLCMDGKSRAEVTDGWAKRAEKEKDGDGRGGAVWRRVAAFSLLQLLLVAAIFAITLTDGGIVFPVLIVALVPGRILVLPRMFGKEEVELLDPREEEG